MNDLRQPQTPKIAAGDGDPRHGTPNGYNNLHCRCQPCRTAGAARRRRLKVQATLLGMDPDDPRHGTTNGYGNRGCRCFECTSAWSAADRARRARRTEAEVTQP